MSVEVVAAAAAGTVAFVTVVKFVGPPLRHGIEDWIERRRSVTRTIAYFPKIVEIVSTLTQEFQEYRKEWREKAAVIETRLDRIEANGSKKGPPDAAL